VAQTTVDVAGYTEVAVINDTFNPTTPQPQVVRSASTSSIRQGSPRTKPQPCCCGFCAGLRAARRRLAAHQNHPIYAARGNEQPLLEQLIASDPPTGGLDQFVSDLDHT